MSDFPLAASRSAPRLPADAVTRTFGIFGMKDSGKTNTGRVLVEGIVATGGHVIVLDPVGVWWGATRAGNGAGIPGVVIGGEHADVPREQADATNAPTTTEQMMLFVKQLVPPAKYRIVEALVSVHPLALAKSELADEVEASASSSSFSNNLSSLRSLGLLDYPQPGYVVASDILFVESR